MTTELSNKELLPRITNADDLFFKARDYTWELYNAPFNIKAPEHMIGAYLLDGYYVKDVYQIDFHRIILGDCGGTRIYKPHPHEVSFHHFTPGGSVPYENSPFRDDVIVRFQFQNYKHPLWYHLRPKNKA